MSGLTLRPSLQSLITGIVTAIFAVFLFALPATAAQGEAYLIVPDMVLGNVEGTEEVFSSLYTELEKQGVPEENISNFRYDPYDGITTITEELSAELDTLTQATGDTQISVLGYGVGGLIVRNYLESDSYTDNIESLVFAATPHEGTIAYTEHIYGRNITYLNAWERLYWEGKDVPMLMKQVLPTNLPLVGVTLEDPALTPLREAVAYSIINDLKNREADPESPIKNLQVTNLRPIGVYDGGYFTAKNIGVSQNTNSYRTGTSGLVPGLTMNQDRTIGSGNVSRSEATLPYGTTKDFWAKHADMVHHGVREVLGGLNLSTSNIPNYHKPGIYTSGNFEYPKQYHAMAIKVDVNDDTELESVQTQGLENYTTYQEEGRTIYFESSRSFLPSFEGEITTTIDSHARQEVFFTTFLSAERTQGIAFDIESISSEVGEIFTTSYTYKPRCTNQSFTTSCQLGSYFEGANELSIDSREWIQYPIVLVHGILGGWNPEMMGVVEEGESKTFRTRGFYKQTFQGKEWIEIEGDNNFQAIRSALAGESFYQFYYDWRQSNVISGNLLDEYISFVKKDSGHDKVQILAHSMGGLVTRSYLQSDQYDQDIARFVMAGTPNHGATDAIPKWEYGQMGAPKSFKPISLLLRWTLSVWHPYLEKDLEDQDRLDIIRGNFDLEGNKYDASHGPVSGIYALEELLPTYPSLRVFTGTRGFGDSSIQMLSNPFLENLNSSYESLHKIDTLFLVGNKENSTAKEFHIRKNDQGEVIRFGGFNEFESGDDTVLIESLILPCENGNELTNDGTECVNESGGNWVREDVEFEHNGLPAEGCGEIMSFLKRNEESCFPDQSFIEFNREYVGFSVASPVDIQIVTPSGKVFNEDQTDEYYASESATYVSLGENGKKLIMLPYEEQGEYRVNLTAVGDGGEYDVITWLETDEQSLDISNSGQIDPNQEKEYFVTVIENEDGVIEEDTLQPILSNTPPVAALDKDQYEGVEGDEIIFDGVSSTDEDGDIIQYRWAISDEGGNEIISTEFSENSSYSYTFEDPFTGTVTLTVTDGEFVEEVTSEITIRAMTFSEKVEQMRELIYSLDEDTSYIRAKKRVWLRLMDTLGLPQVINDDRIKNIILEVIVNDIERSLYIDGKFNSRWGWLKRNLISSQNEDILQEVLDNLEVL